MAKKHVILFAGTTEGRILANWLDEQSGVTGIVCVATEYGAELLEEEMSLKHRCHPSLCPGGDCQYPESL